jgi:hypothetical protein
MKYNPKVSSSRRKCRKAHFSAPSNVSRLRLILLRVVFQLCPMLLRLRPLCPGYTAPPACPYVLRAGPPHAHEHARRQGAPQQGYEYCFCICFFVFVFVFVFAC